MLAGKQTGLYFMGQERTRYFDVAQSAPLTTGFDQMPKGPKGQKRPADVIGNAVKVMKIATGEIEEEYTEDGKNKAAAELGKKGGKARAQILTPEERSNIAKKAAKSRWSGKTDS